MEMPDQTTSLVGEKWPIMCLGAFEVGASPDLHDKTPPFGSHWHRSLPASLPARAGGGFGGPGGDDLTVDGAQQQHEPDGPEHLGGRYPMRPRDGHVEYRRHHCRRRPERSVQQYKRLTP